MRLDGPFARRFSFAPACACQKETAPGGPSNTSPRALQKRLERRVALQGLVVDAKGHGFRAPERDLCHQRRVRRQILRQDGNAISRRDQHRSPVFTAGEVPTEATEMFQSIKYEDKREVFGFKVHSFSTFEKIKKYDETDNAESAEKPYSIEVGRTKRTINLYAIASTKFQIAC